MTKISATISTTARLKICAPASSDAGSATVEKAEMTILGKDVWLLAPEFRGVKWPKKFKIDIRHYDGTTNPRDFLQLYLLAATVTGADEMIMTSWFPLALEGDAQTDRKSTRLNSSHITRSRMPSSA